jgi:CheY-like chemotaxis protein
LESKGRDVITDTDGRKCIDAYKRFNLNGHENYFDVVILDQKMPFMTELRKVVEILEIFLTKKIFLHQVILKKHYLKY